LPSLPHPTAKLGKKQMTTCHPFSVPFLITFDSPLVQAHSMLPKFTRTTNYKALILLIPTPRVP
jgi:hypothetical protein